MLVADDNERDHAKKYGEDDEAFNYRINKLYNDWESFNYQVISMKNDFKTIYGDNVTKTDFIFKLFIFYWIRRIDVFSKRIWRDV